VITLTEAEAMYMLYLIGPATDENGYYKVGVDWHELTKLMGPECVVPENRPEYGDESEDFYKAEEAAANAQQEWINRLRTKLEGAPPSLKKVDPKEMWDALTQMCEVSS
jgi:hypothetical protein